MSETTVHEALDRYLAIIERTLRPKTVSTYRLALDALRARHGHRELTALSVADLELLAAERSERLSPASIHRELRTWSTFFSACVRWGLLEANPAAGVPKPRLPRNLPQVLSREQAVAQLRLARRAGPSIFGMVATGLYAGLRLQELLSLEWTDVASERLYVRNKPRCPVKDYEERSIPVVPDLWAVYQELPADMFSEGERG